jgi:predicted secreted Zn-dependent protease
VPPPPRSQGRAIVLAFVFATVAMFAFAVIGSAIVRARVLADLARAEERSSPPLPAPPVQSGWPPRGAPTSTAPLARDPRVTEIIYRDDYAIAGHTEAALRREMNASGPLYQGKRFAALTNWYVTWSYPRARSLWRCATGPVTATLTIVYNLPDWTDASTAKPGLVDEWRRYMQALQTHEDGHAEHGREAAVEVVRTLSALPPATGCSALDGVANEKARAIVLAHMPDDATYDAVTRHGWTQGAHFP